MTYRPRLCVSVTADSLGELRARRDAVRDADMVELRLDGVADPDVAGALQGRRLPVIVTCRAAWEGGAFSGSEEERRRLLDDAIGSDAEYVDLEWRGGFEDLVRRRRGQGIVLSAHDFQGVPRDLAGQVRAMAATDAEVVKAAVTVRRLDECVPLLALSRGLGVGRSVLLGMGDAGLVTRVCAARLGSAWSYAGAGVAPGQASPERMHREFGFRRIGSATAVYGLLGQPVGHSLSPAMHNAGFAETGTDAVYLPLPAADITDFDRFRQAFDLAGVSVTAPYKTTVLGLVAERSAAVRETGAANTLTREATGLAADNTDVEGFLAPLAGESVAGARAAVLGSGGAARAAAVALRQQGALVTIYGRDASKARAAAAELGVAGAQRPVPPGSWDVLVNATPVGTFPQDGESAFPEAVLDGHLVYDLVYNPPETALVRQARHAGCRAIGGLDMLVAQARLQQQRWIGRAPAAESLRAAALWKLSTFASTR